MTIGEQLQRLWPGWVIDGELGTGSFGKVYRIRRNAHGRTYYSALKHIKIPSDQKQLDLLQAEGMNEQSIKIHLSKAADNCLNEIDIMSSLKGTSNIVYIEDFQVLSQNGGTQWDIFVKMELLSGLIDQMKTGYFTEKQVFKVAMDLTNALIQCEKLNMIHRDIKPANILVSTAGDYKLGDFGAARQISKTTLHMTQIGTVSYMAPELYRGDGYDHRVDIYSLGILLYTLANRNRMPFVNPYRQDLSPQEREEATRYRLNGGKLTPPACVGNEFARIILKACEYKPKNRYPSALAMRQDLIRIMPLIMSGKDVPDRRKDNNPAAANANNRTSGFLNKTLFNGATSTGTISKNKPVNGSADKTGNPRNKNYSPAKVQTGGNTSSGKPQTGGNGSSGKPQTGGNGSSGKPQTGKNNSPGKTRKPDSLKVILALLSLLLIALIAFAVKSSFTGKSKTATSKTSSSDRESGRTDANDTTTDTETETESDDGAFVLKPDSDNMSSVHISAPQGYELSLATPYKLTAYNPESSVKLSGYFSLMSNKKDPKENLRNTYDYIDNDIGKKEQHCDAASGRVYYVTASTGDTVCTCWMEYDANTLIVFTGKIGKGEADLSDQIKTIFSGVQAP